jgi:feruloyl esterase
MLAVRSLTLAALLMTTAVLHAQPASPRAADDRTTCEALIEMPNVTVTYAVFKPKSAAIPEHCYMRGSISGNIRFHMQLPLRSNWNGRLLVIGDGGQDGTLNYDNEHLAEGYAIANSNTGHDNGVEPESSFAYENLQAVIDFGYRAVHLLANASKTVVRAYYTRPAQYSYFSGCSGGGRQAMMESQRFPEDFDGILGGAPVFEYQTNGLTNVWMAQKVFNDNFAGDLSPTKLGILRDAVLSKCDANDGIRDKMLDDPRTCKFNPDVDLAPRMCTGDVNKDDCFTKRQIQTIKDFYSGPYDSKGLRFTKGMALGSEWGWQMYFRPSEVGEDHANFLFYKESPGLPPSRIGTPTDKNANPPEFAWWDFNMDEYTAGKSEYMARITDATNPDLTRFLKRENGKLILYHGWADQNRQPEPTVDYYDAMVNKTFGGNLEEAKEKARLFMIPGMGHCRGGPGLAQWDGLPALVDWVEKGTAPESIVGEHRTNGVVDNRRPVCAYPKRATYAGPAGGENNPANWIENNFVCR